MNPIVKWLTTTFRSSDSVDATKLKDDKHLNVAIKHGLVGRDGDEVYLLDSTKEALLKHGKKANTKRTR